jgi:acetyltransferase-like isoleucine patch superfamily enzyme
MSKIKKIIIFGIGQIAELVKDLVDENPNLELNAFCADKEFVVEDKFCGYELVSTEEVNKKFSPKDFYFITALSYSNLNKNGENNIIFELNNVQKGVRIGNNCIFWSGNHIGHHSIIKDNCFISSHTVISGNVEVGANSFIGVNSTVRDNIVIGEKCIIGANSLILKNLKSNSVVRVKQSEISKITSDKLI